MQHLTNVSAQRVSWVKSNKDELEKSYDAIKNLYYPETSCELKELVSFFYKSNKQFDIIGYSSNTLFLPSYKIENLICTKKITEWRETETEIICGCGVNVAKFAKDMIKKGYEGFSGLTDLPGTIASAVYGNCGCYDCSINSILKYITFFTPSGKLLKLTAEQLKLGFRTSALKRNELAGVIIEVVLLKKEGDSTIEIKKAELAHAERKKNQPSAANNLGSTFNASELTLKGKVLFMLIKIISFIFRRQEKGKIFKFIYPFIGAYKYVNYLDVWNRYMFKDARAHKLFPSYVDFFKTIYRDAHLEIEIKR